MPWTDHLTIDFYPPVLPMMLLTPLRPRVVTTTPTGVIKKILICPSVLIIESRQKPVYILYYLPTNFLYSSSSFLHASDSDRPS